MGYSFVSVSPTWNEICRAKEVARDRAFAQVLVKTRKCRQCPRFVWILYRKKVNFLWETTSFHFEEKTNPLVKSDNSSFTALESTEWIGWSAQCWFLFLGPIDWIERAPQLGTGWQDWWVLHRSFTGLAFVFSGNQRNPIWSPLRGFSRSYRVRLGFFRWSLRRI